MEDYLHFAGTVKLNDRDWELLEILSQQTKIECLENLEVLKELVKGYKDSYITAHLLVEYNRIAFVRLMALLNKEEIENNIHNLLLGL